MRSLFLCCICTMLCAASWELSGPWPTWNAGAPASVELDIRVWPLHSKEQAPAFQFLKQFRSSEDCRLTLDMPRIEAPFRAKVCLHAEGYAPLWTTVWPNGTLRWEPPRLQAGLTWVYGRVENADGTPRAYATVWGDARGTILGYTDEQGAFRLAVDLSDTEHPPRIVLHDSDIIGGWHLLLPGSSAEQPQVMRTTAARHMAVRLVDQCGSPIANIELRGGGGGGSRSDAEGRMVMGSLYTNKPTPVSPRGKGFLETPDQLQLDASGDDFADHEMTLTIPMEPSALCTLETGDLLFWQETTAQGEARPCLGWYWAPPAEIADAAPLCIQATRSAQRQAMIEELNSRIRKATNYQFAAYRLRDPALRQRLHTLLGAWLCTNTSVFPEDWEQTAPVLQQQTRAMGVLFSAALEATPEKLSTWTAVLQQAIATEQPAPPLELPQTAGVFPSTHPDRDARLWRVFPNPDPNDNDTDF